jgi:N-acetylglutamate synthase-like GNAT family acetyltransferase
MSLTLRRAAQSDCAALTDVCFRSKQANGYDDAFMEACRAELTISPETLAQKIFWMAEDDGVALGCAALTLVSAQQGEVSMFFVDPKVQGRRVGRMFWTTLFRLAHEQGLSTLELDADLTPVGFYEKQGFVEIGTAASASISGRLLPRMQLNLR